MDLDTPLRHQVTCRRGVSVLELLIVMALATLMSAIAFPIWTRSQHGLDVRSAQGVFMSMQRRARVLAVERGERVRFHVSFPGDSIWITSSAGTEESISLRREWGVNVVRGSGVDLGEHWICNGARGFADRSCNSFSGSQEVRFELVDHVERVRILPLGQVEAL